MKLVSVCLYGFIDFVLINISQSSSSLLVLNLSSSTIISSQHLGSGGHCVVA